MIRPFGRNFNRAGRDTGSVIARRPNPCFCRGRSTRGEGEVNPSTDLPLQKRGLRSARRGRARPCPVVIASPRRGRGNPCFENHQIASLGWSAGGLSPEYWQFYHSSNANQPQTNNITNFADADMDQLIDHYRAELSKPVRVELAQRMEQKVFESGAMIPTFKVPYTREAYWAWIRLPAGYATRSSGSVVDAMGTGLFWIDVEEKNRIRALRRHREALSAPVTIIDETWK